MTSDRIDPEKINDATINFFTDWTEANLQLVSEEAIERAIREVTNGLEKWVDTSLSNLNEASISSVLESIAKTFERSASSSQFQPNQTTNTSPNIWQAIANFFTDEDWPFVQIQGEQILQMAVSVQNEKWTCYAQAIEEQSLFIFYSICPIKAPESKRQVLAEFLTKVNYDLIIGNFQLDLTSGQIRYKTSIDVSDSTLSMTQIKNLVYTNVTMMDSHLPEILSIINSESPSDAIISKETPPSSDFNEQIDDAKESQQVAVATSQHQQLCNSQARELPAQENTPPSEPSFQEDDVEESQLVVANQDKHQELCDAQTRALPAQGNTPPSHILHLEAEPPKPCSQVEPGNENIEDLPPPGARSEPSEVSFQPDDVENSQDVAANREKHQQLYDAQARALPALDNPVATNLKEQADIPFQEEKSSIETDVLSELTTEETASFESAMQLAKAGKLNAAKTILAQLKNNLIAELGSEGEQIFYGANNLFQLANLPPARINELNGFDKVLPPGVQNLIPVLINPFLECNSVKIDYEFAADKLVSQIQVQVGAKTATLKLKSYFGTLKHIYRYWDISSQLKPLLQRIRSMSNSQLQLSVNSATIATLNSLENIPDQIQSRLLQLATEKLESQFQVDVLLEIGDLQALLAQTKRILLTEKV
ncbi:MAG TPA: YbjN domain-containing protein [Cyanobacteria bacterium UBA8543]|nr:YbjN domain-containing protein [Cyanobacteria bacterium UBA8543]